MLNAKDATLDPTHRFFLLGDTGSGKTTQFLTLPGKKYMHVFDPNALLALHGHDVDFDDYLPSNVSAAATSLTKGKGDQRATVASSVYQTFESEFDARIKSGFFNPYSWIGFDSATNLLDLIMDRVLTINGRYGQWPQQDDYGPQMIAFTNLCRTITAMGKGLFMTGHLEVKQDKVSQKITNRPLMTGRLAVKIPLLFSDIFYTDVDLDEKGHAVYRVQTVPNMMNRTIRTAMKGLEPYENVTIDWSKPVEGQGIAGLLSYSKKQGGT